MCGICGIIYKDKSKVVDREVLARMNQSLTHRGPDEEGYFINRNTGLGMRRLSIIDVKGGHQPLFNEDRSICVICNGEIYNYQELRRELEQKGHKFSTKSDIEVIVHLYEDLKESFVHKLRGMFAIAIWDSLEDKLILIRDRLGIKPLYHTYQKGVFLFASELKGILQYPGLEKNLSLEALSDYLSYFYIPAAGTIFEGIFKVPPAHMLSFNKGNISLSKYWEIDYAKKEERTKNRDADRLRLSARQAARAFGCGYCSCRRQPRERRFGIQRYAARFIGRYALPHPRRHSRREKYPRDH